MDKGRGFKALQRRNPWPPNVGRCNVYRQTACEILLKCTESLRMATGVTNKGFTDPSMDDNRYFVTGHSLVLHAGTA